jgi:hypothetical protein
MMNDGGEPVQHIPAGFRDEMQEIVEMRAIGAWSARRQAHLRFGCGGSRGRAKGLKLRITKSQMRPKTVAILY